MRSGSEEAIMELNADFSKRAAVHAARLPWSPSPIAGVERRMLDRIGEEVARATSIVRYAPRSHFSPHTHGGGEEFLVLDGVFSDEQGDFPAGAYIRNPPTSRHTPGSEPGCTIFVKLWQFDPEDRRQMRIDTTTQSFLTAPERPGVEVMPLHQDAHETVRLERWRAGAEIALPVQGGIEILVLDGAFSEGGERFEPQSWLRLPAGARLTARAGAEGCKVWVKTGHLARPQAAPSVAA
jgi:anti-sigma factor ChrR (cupin superfamily)